jgi:hypothetical protein
MRTLSLALIISCGAANIASAAPIVYSFTGTLTGSAPSNETNAALSQLTAGDPFSGSFWYSFTEPPLSVTGVPAGGTYEPTFQGSYAQPNLVFTLSYEIKLGDFTLVGSGGTGDPGTAPVVRITDGTTDRFALSDEVPDSSLGRYAIDELLLGLNFAGTAFADRSMPGLLDPGAFQGGTFRMTVLPNPCTGSACYDLFGTIDTLRTEAVPEPTGLMLGALGLAAAMAGRRRRLRRATNENQSSAC